MTYKECHPSTHEMLWRLDVKSRHFWWGFEVLEQFIETGQVSRLVFRPFKGFLTSLPIHPGSLDAHWSFGIGVRLKVRLDRPNQLQGMLPGRQLRCFGSVYMREHGSHVVSSDILVTFDILMRVVENEAAQLPLLSVLRVKRHHSMRVHRVEKALEDKCGEGRREGRR